MTRSGNREVQPSQNLQCLRSIHDLALDAGTHEEEIGDHAGLIAHEANRRQATSRLMLDGRDDLVPLRSHGQHDVLGISAIHDADREISVSGQPRFGAV